MRPRITILCANLKGNLGDFALVEAIVRAVQNYRGDCLFDLFYHANKKPDQARLDTMLAEMEVELSSIAAAPFKRRPRWLRTFCRLGIARGLHARWHNRQIAAWAERISKMNPFMERLNGSEQIIFAGGAQWGRGDLNLNMFAQLKAAASTGRPVRAFPFSVSEGLEVCNGRDALAGLFADLTSPILVRDGISRDSLNRAGVHAHLVCDSVFSLGCLFKASWRPREPSIVYISLTQSGSTTLHQVVEMLDSLKAADLRPVLFSNCETEDRTFYRSIQEQTEVEAVYPMSWKQAVSDLSEGLFVITNRLHCLIFSALTKTPVIPVTNRSKSKAYVRDAGLPCFLEKPGALSSEQIALFNQSLAHISERQGRFAADCAVLLDQRLGDFFRSEEGSAE